MRRIRTLVESDPRLDATVAADMAMMATDQIDQTPSLVLISKDGTRQKVAGVESFDLLKAYLDEMPAK